MKGRVGRRSRCARDTLASRRSPSSLPSACNPFLYAVFPMGNVVTYRSSWKPRQSRWKLNRRTVSSLSLSLPLSLPPFLFRFLRHRFSPSVPLPLRQRANVFASRSLRRFQIISRPIVLLLTTRAVSLSSIF